jgi:cholest-4-en-3-one 26-monooxygenase
MMPFQPDNPDLYVRGTPHAAFAHLRNKTPFSWHESYDSASTGFWLATKYRDVLAISKDPARFATHSPLLSDPLPTPLWSTYPALASIANNLMTFDHDKHGAFKRVGNLVFSNSRIKDAESAVRHSCAEIVRRASTQSKLDFATDVALAIPVNAVLGTFLGIPSSDLPLIIKYVLSINAMDDPLFRPTREALLDAARDLWTYGMSLLQHVRECPGGDFFSEVLHAANIMGVTTEELFLAYWFPLVAGAFDTTASTIAGGTLALLQYPVQLKVIQNDPSIVPLAVEEMLRWVTPVLYFRRTATSDTNFNGTQIKRGQKIVLSYASANRDEDAFAAPHLFDVRRTTPPPHLSFGYGPHYCLGARIASLILRIFLEMSLELISNIQLDGDVLHTRSAWMNRIRTMPVKNNRPFPLALTKS